MYKKITFLIVLVILGCSKDDGIDIVDNTIVPLEKCVNGFAGIYPCKDYDLLAHIPISELGQSDQANDSWGWVDPQTQREYGLVCTNKGVSFIDITEPVKPVNLGFLSTATIGSAWRDVKIYKNFAFIVADNADAHGMQIFDLTKLRNVSNPPVIFNTDAHYKEFGSAHNIIINEDSGFAYALGSDTFNGGPHFIDINDPTTPVKSGGYSNDNYSHDAQVVTYTGPDSDYTGKEIFIGSNGIEIVILDITDKANPVRISSINYDNIGYVHQGWFTEDMAYFILGDEIDEINFGGNTRTIIFDFTDLDNPKQHMDYFGPTAAIDHNGYVKGNTFYQANYTAGVRMIDISGIENKNVNEVGFFDTFPESNATSFGGAWNVYPYFPSGNIIVSDLNRGFFVIRKSGS